MNLVPFPVCSHVDQLVALDYLAIECGIELHAHIHLQLTTFSFTRKRRASSRLLRSSRTCSNCSVYRTKHGNTRVSSIYHSRGSAWKSVVYGRARHYSYSNSRTK